MRKQQQNNAALYLRLSRDDGGDVESNSIGNQRAILQRYAREAGFDIIDEYVDDGWSGTNFDRPSLKRMLGDIDDGKIGIVLCKDLSRFGRNNAMVSYYTELFFPENDIRFVAVNDGIDSAKGDNEIMPFKSIINEYYARDISKKIRSAYKAQALKGAYTGPVPPYGYMKSPENKYLLIPDPETAGVVRRLFGMAASGCAPYTIARTFTDEKILVPNAYNKKKHSVGFKESNITDTCWNPNTIRGFIRNEVYIGHMVSQKQSTKSYKSKKIVRLPEEDRIRVENTHEALVDQETFDLANKCFKAKRMPNKHGFVNIFVGLIKCADCGSGLQYVYPTKSIPSFGYQCNRYRHYARRLCTSHYIKYDNVYDIVLQKIQQKVRFVNEHRDKLAEYAQKLATQNFDNDLKQVRSEIEKSQRRCRELDFLIQKLFEQNATGVLSDERFVTLSGAYEVEQKALKTKIADLQNRLSEQENSAQDTLRFFNLVSKYTVITELTAENLNDLIDTIVVHAPEGQRSRKARKQKVEVNFRFIQEKWFEKDLSL